MCGIMGIYHRDPKAALDVALGVKMTEQLVHRGPDDGGVVALGPALLGQRRLSILDLSPAGHQPLCTPDERYWITFNGELYNYKELRATLEQAGVAFRTQTDTEVLLQWYVVYGPGCLERLNGMYAFAIYDRQAHRLFLARDRLGKKPLYLWDDGERLCFASEIKAFFVDPTFRFDVDPAALLECILTLYPGETRTAYTHVRSLRPAHALTLDASGLRQRRYWYFPVGEPQSPFSSWVREEAALEQLEPLLADAVRLRLASDVPLGAFLSGGVDSSLVVSEMSRACSAPVLTNAIGFSVKSEDESAYAEQVARHFRCQHQTFHARIDDAAALLEQLLWHFDGPFADASALPTWLLSRATRQRVTVALSGDGGDEGFAGYEKYRWDQQERLMRMLLPRRLWGVLAQGLRGLPMHGVSHQLLGLLRTLSLPPEDAFYLTQTFTLPSQGRRLFSPDVRAGLRDFDPGAATRAAFLEASGADFLTKAQWVDLTTFLPGDILVKVDRMSMAHALEVRSPLLDHRILELALRLPWWLRLGPRRGKHLLKRLLERRMPPEWVGRPKHGFTIPVDLWMKGALGQMLEDELRAGPIRSSGLLESAEVMKCLEQHRKGEHRGMTLWSLLCLSLWWRRVRKGDGGPTLHGAPTQVRCILPTPGPG